MYLDKENLFSEDQAIASTVVSTNVIDLGADHANAPDYHNKGAVMFWTQVTRSFTGGNTVRVELQTSDAENFSPNEVLHQSSDINTNDLVAGYQFRPVAVLTNGVKRYLRTRYVCGEQTDGDITAGLVLDVQTAGMTAYNM